MRKHHPAAPILLLLMLFASLLLVQPAQPSLHPITQIWTLETEWRIIGTAVPVQNTPEGFTIFLTAKHVVEAAGQPAFSLHHGKQKYDMVRVEQCEKLDLAAVWVQGVVPVVPLDYAPSVVGERLEGGGFIYGRELTLTEGLVPGHGAVSIDVLPGCSGGPILRNRKLVGIIATCVLSPCGDERVAVGALCGFVEICDAAEWLSGILR